MIGIIGGNGVAATNRLLHLIENEVVNGGGVQRRSPPRNDYLASDSSSK